MSTQDAPERGPVTLAGRPARLLLIQAPYYAEVVGAMRSAAGSSKAPGRRGQRACRAAMTAS